MPKGHGQLVFELPVGSVIREKATLRITLCVVTRIAL